MDGRERLLTTLRGERADRVPVAPFLYYNSVYEMFGYRPDIDTFFDPPDFDPIEKFVEYCEYFGFDILHSLGSVWDFYSASNSTRDLSFVRAWENWDVTVADERTGGDEKFRTVTIETPDGNLRMVEVQRRSSEHLVVSALVEYPIKAVRDFENLRRYAPPPDEMDCRLVSRARQAVASKGLVCTCTHGVFNTLAQFRRLEDVMIDPMADEGLYREMMNFFLECLIKRARKLVQAGADVIEVGANLATSAVGPRFFSNYVMEYESHLLDAIHELGALVILHNCGDASRIMHLYNDMPIDCWGYVTPPPAADVELDEALRVIRPNMALRGNLDQVEFLVKATPAEIRDRVGALLRRVRHRGNWILSATDFFFDGTPYENIRAFAEAGLEYGAYEHGGSPAG